MKPLESLAPSLLLAATISSRSAESKFAPGLLAGCCSGIYSTIGVYALRASSVVATEAVVAAEADCLSVSSATEGTRGCFALRARIAAIVARLDCLPGSLPGLLRPAHGLVLAFLWPGESVVGECSEPC